MKLFIVLAEVALLTASATAQCPDPNNPGGAPIVCDAAEVLSSISKSSERGIPRDLLSKAFCIVVVPNSRKGGFIVGAEYGHGLFSCRKSNGAAWTTPGGVKLAGSKFGLLTGDSPTDIVLLIMNRDGKEQLLSEKFRLGGDASAAAGPVGRDSSAMTDAELHTGILAYTRQGGVMGGIDLDEATLAEDKRFNRDFYGKEISNKQLANGDVNTPADARMFVHTLNRLSSVK